jgi:hypothetical protein
LSWFRTAVQHPSHPIFLPLILDQISHGTPAA